MKTLLRFVVLLLAWGSLGLADAWAQTNTLDYSTAATGSRKTATETLGGTSFTYNYGTGVNGNIGAFTVATDGNLGNTQVLVWQVNQPVGSPEQVQVTLNFTRPVSNLTFNFIDLDAGTPANAGSDFIDQIQFQGYPTTSGGSQVGVTATPGSANTFISPDIVRGSAASGANATNGNATVSFSSAVQRVVLTYDNVRPVNTNNPTRLHTLGIRSISWAAQADVATTLTGPALASAGNRVIYTATTTNNGSDAAVGVVPSLQLTPNLPATSVTLPTGATYTAATGVVTFASTSVAAGASVTNAVTLTMPATGNLTGRASNTATTADNVAGNNNGTATNANVTTVQTAPSCQPSYLTNNTASNGLTAEYYPNVFYNPGNNFNASAITYFQRTATVRRIDPLLDFSGSGFGGIVPPATGTTADPNVFSARYRGSINIPVAGAYTFYLTSDDGSYMWLDGNALATAPNVNNALINNGGDHGSTEVSATITLTAGQHDVLILFAENGGDNILKWEYESAAAGLARQVVPTAVLCAGPSAANAAPVATTLTNVTLPNTAPATILSANLTGTDADGNNTLAYYNIVTLPAAGAGVLAFNGTAVVAGQAIPANQLNLLTFDPAPAFTGSPSFTYSVTDNGGRTSQNATYTIPVANAVTLSGTVFEDVNYGGGAGRTYATANTAATGFTSGTIRRPNARVELYDANGNFVSATTTNATGGYTFSVAPTGYTVRVVNSTVTSVRPGYVAGLLPVQTFVNGATDLVGGIAPEKQDAASNTTNQALSALTTGAGATALTPQSIAEVTVPTGGSTGVDFGFNFDVVSNTNDSGQGSLRQFILNSNALTNANLAQNGGTAGTEASIFMIPSGSATSGLRAGLVSGLTNGVAIITPATALPTVTDANTAIDGTEQTQNVGNTNAAVLGAGGTVGTANTTLGRVNGPEVQLVGTRNFEGIVTSGTSTTLRGLSVYGFTNGIRTTDTATGFLAEQNVIGASATSFTDPGTGVRGTEQGIQLGSSDGGIVRNNLIGYNGGMGVWVLNGADDNLISGNEVRGNAQEVLIGGEGLVFDGIELQGASTRNTVSGNLITETLGHGIDSFGNTIGGNTITGNTISNNGQGVVNGTGAEGAGLRIYGATNTTTISNNVLTGNNGSGVLVIGSANNILISQNSMSDNTRLGIDLLSTAESNTEANNYNGLTGTASNVTINDSGDPDTGGNGLLNFPVITSATIRNGNLIVQGYARPNSVIELFTPSSTANSVAANVGFGQGQAYLGSFTENSAADTDGGTGTYGPGNVNGLAQGTDNTSRFSFTIPLTGNFAAYAAGSRLTSTATVGTSTSEFSGNVTVLAAPVANNDFTTTTPGTAVTFNVTTNDQNSIDAATVNLNGQGAGSTTSVSVTGGSFQFLNNGQVRFTPTAGFTGIATVPYTVLNTAGVASNTAYFSVEVRNPAIDLATTITAPANNTTINGGAALTYVVDARNNSSTPVSGVVETLQLPAGLTNNGGTVIITGGANAASATYDNVTGRVTIPVGTLAATTTQTYNVAVSAMPGSGPVTATASISGIGTESNTANNTNSTTVTINPRYDVATTISGPATNVVRGNEVTYTVTTSNLSTTVGSVSPAPNVIQKVRLPLGLTGVYASNGGTYDATTGDVTFPALASLPVGQTVVNSISFVAPSANFAALTATVTAGASSDNAGDINSATSGTNNNTANLNNSTAAVTTVAGGSAVNVYTTISSSASAVAPSGSVTLTVVTGNAGPNQATGVIETLQLPAGLTANGTVTVSNGGTYDNATGLVTFASIGTLASGATNPVAQTVTFVAPTQGFVLATATAYTTSADALPADNLAQTKVEINPQADVATTLAGPATVTPGQVVTYTVTTTSNAEGAASGVVQRVMLPAGLTGVTVSNGTYDATTGIVTISFPNALAKGFAQTNSISYTVPTGAVNYVATASVSTSTPETVLTNNSATVTTTVQVAVDVRVAVSGPASAPVGSPVTYVVTSTNNGPSTAAAVATTLQLPAGLTAGGTVTVSGTGTYDNTTGLVTFDQASVLANGGSVSNTVTLTMPDVSQLSGVARVSSTTTETNLDNNVALVATTGAAQTGTTAATTANLSTSISPSAATVAPGTSVTLTANFSNAAGSATASTVVPRIALPAGLNAFGTVTVVGGTNGSYDNATGLVTWNSVSSLAGGASLPLDTYKVTFVVPNNGTVRATSIVSSATSDIVPGNNVAPATINVTPTADPAISISGPVSVQPGATVTYAVMTLNNGASLASSTQTVSIPSGATNITYSGANGPVSVASGTTSISFPPISNQPAGVAGEITNYVTFTAPSANYTVTATLTPGSNTGDVVGNNTATANTAINRAPVAYNVVNSLQTPEANTAGSLLISPLVATDADATQTLTYTITSLPATAAGDLYVGTTKVTTLAQVASLSAAQISTLRFDPAAGFIGNAFFNYTATDNATTATGTSIAATSNTATYTIAVGQDVNSVYATTPLKGGASPYQNGDIIAYVTDTNGARYTSAGVVYNATTGVLESGASNGLPTTGTNATTNAAGATQLANLGLALDPATGQIYIVDRTKLRTAGTYTISVTTVDVNGGTNTQNVTFSIGTRPLPVELKIFEVAAQKQDAKLTWTTASEKSNDHFDVERSFDGRTFERIGQVRGQGTSTQATNYAFTDANVGSKHQGVVYYRLQQVDTDGTASYSPVRTVSFSAPVVAEVKLGVFPNPATDQDRTATLDLSTLPQGAYQATLLDATGRIMGTYSVQGGVNKALDVQALPVGTYIVLVRGNGLNLSQRLIKK